MKFLNGGRKWRYSEYFTHSVKEFCRTCQLAQNINNSLDQNVFSGYTAREWFGKIQEGRTNSEPKKAQSRPLKSDLHALRQRLQRNPYISSAQLAAEHCSKATALRYLPLSGTKPKKSKWVAHRLSLQNKQKRKKIWLNIASIHRLGHFLPNLITFYEIWFNYDSMCEKWCDRMEKKTLLWPRNRTSMVKSVCYAIFGPGLHLWYGAFFLLTLTSNINTIETSFPSLHTIINNYKILK